MRAADSATRSSTNAADGRGLASRILRSLSAPLRGKGTGAPISMDRVEPASAAFTPGGSVSFTRSAFKAKPSTASMALATAALAVVALLSVGLSSAAAAEIGGSRIHSFWGNITGNGTVGGQFQSQGPRGVAVYDDTGDVYVADSGNNRVQQFDATGNFIRAWGQDVISGLGVPPNSNGIGYEICDTTTLPANTADQCKAGTTSAQTGGAMNRPAGIAIDQATGNVHVVDPGNNASTGNRIQVFDSDGTFLRAFGQDVVAGTGGENAPARPAQQSLTVDATAGQFRLAFQGVSSGDVAFDAPATGADSVQEALEGLGSIGTGNVTVTGPAGGPYAIAFAGALTNSPQPLIATSDGTIPLSGGTATATTATTQTGATGFEVCTFAANCKAGTSAATSGGVINMPFPNGATVHGDLAVAPPGAPNAGNVLVTDPNRARVQEFTAAGEFVRAFGYDVAAAGPGNTGTAFEVCNASNFDICKVGVSAAGDANGDGQFAAEAVNRIAEDADGNIYTVEGRNNQGVGASNFRVQQFTLSAGNVTPHGPFACPVLCGTSSSGDINPDTSARDYVVDLAVDRSGYVYAMKAFQRDTGDPPVVFPDLPSIQQHQLRVLKVDPVTGQVVDTFLANPGDRLHASEMTFAVHGSGLPLYAASNVPSGSSGVFSRVYRLDDIGFSPPSISVSDVSAASATLKATITPADIDFDTAYYFEYSRVGMDDWSEFRTPAAADIVDVGVNIGNGVDGGESSSCSPAAGRRAAICHVSQRIDGLDLNQAYEYRVVVRTTPLNGLVYTSDPGQFETVPTPPTAITDAAVWSGPPASDPSLTFSGRVNPQGLRTTYRFEYVTGTEFVASGYANAASAPFLPRDIGGGVVDLDVTPTAAGLDPSSVYHFRIVAANAEGTTVGVDRVVEPAQPSDRFIELVTRGDSQGAGISAGKLTIADGGERAMFTAFAFGEQPSAPFILNPNIARRGSSGWVAAQVGPAPDDAVDARSGFSGDGNAQVTKRLWIGEPSFGEFQWASRGLDGGLTPVPPVLSPLARSGTVDPGFLGASPDLSTIAFSFSNGTLFPGEALVAGGSNLYAISGANGAGPSLDLVNRDDGGNVIGGACGAQLGSVGSVKTRSVSADGSVVYFSARPGAPTNDCVGNFFNPLPGARVFKRENATTVPVSESQCDREAPDPPCSTVAGDDHYWGASADASKVFFMTNRQLADSDLDQNGPFGFSGCVGAPALLGGCDLYLYDSSPPAGQPNLVQVSAGEATDTHPTVGSGAGLLGVTGIAMDGSRVYFVAAGKLAEGATDGANNLYVYERSAAVPDGRIDFVATLSPRPAEDSDRADSDLWTQNIDQGGRQAHALPYYDGLGEGRGDGDGHLLVFVSEAKLLPAEDLDAVNDVYRYDDETGDLECLSCVGDGDRPVRLTGLDIGSGDGDLIQRHRIASEDGSMVVFDTEEPLVEEDANTANDVYVWGEGDGLSLISAATGDVGAAAMTDGNPPAISPDGRSVFFLTRATILPQDTNNGALDWYVARVGGGFPQPVEPAVCALLAGVCQGDGASPLPTQTETRSSRPAGAGDAAPGVRKRLALARLSAKARRRAARTGVLVLRVGSNKAGRVAVVVRGRVGKRVRRVGRASERLSRPGVVRVRVRLNRPARKRLRSGRRLAVAIRVRSAGARPESLRVVLRRAGK